MQPRFLLLAIAAFTLSAVYAVSGPTTTKAKAHNAPRTAADCAPASGLDFLDFNNINALIETGGSMWQDRPNNNAAYEVPAKSGKKSIFSGSLWMGGTDANDQLKIAAVTFRNGTNDFWTGPLTIDGAAEIRPEVCTQYDHFFHITKQDVVLFITYWNCKTNGVGCDALPSNYRIPKVILEWPAHGDEALGQDFYLAPFFDRNGDGVYDPEGAGDYPYYDINNEVNCRAVRDIRLFGDDTYWWVFNDKGNIHTETNGQSIGMEIRAQAFAFATNDEVNNMTFYNYELINRSTFTLYNTYFAQWVDADIGGAFDDYVGCDVQRGLGYAYNGDDFDEDANGVNGYGDHPPAVGVDFFEGPYQDNDGINNLVGIGAGEALNGVGYLNPKLDDEHQDKIVDNERYGMRRFIYYNNGGGNRGDAFTALDHYNYMRSIWKDGQKMTFGGNGHPTDAGSIGIEADFMFPGDSDPLNWGTRGEAPGFSWTEVTAGNPAFDRRFLQSAGPFTLRPGAVNDITVGVVWAQAASGSAEESVSKLIQADSKAQALFDNCFKVLDGPDAPDLAGVELNREIILFLTNKKALSNNYKKYPGDYQEVDPFIIAEDGQFYDNVYRFQGYQIYQVSDIDVSINDLDNLDKARLAFQCDVKDSITDLVNYYFDEELGATVPKYMVKNAPNEGIKTTFRVTEDLFATGSPALVNFKTYYYLAIAYAYNNYKTYSETVDGLEGQKLPYLQSRKGTTGGIKAVSFTPHPTQPLNGGTILHAAYGSQPQITRIEGQGNGGRTLAFTPKTVEKILKNSADPKSNFPTYKAGYGPVGVKVVDPMSVPDGQFTMKFYYDDQLNDLMWKLWRNDGSPGLNDTVYAETGISTENEQIINKWGVSVSLEKPKDPADHIQNNYLPEQSYNNGAVSATMTFKDSSQIWLTGVSDQAGNNYRNWIRGGVVAEEDDPLSFYNSLFARYRHDILDTSITLGCPLINDTMQEHQHCLPLDPNSNYEKLLNGTWAPFALCAYTVTIGSTPMVRHAPAPTFVSGLATKMARLEDIQSVDIVITKDKSLWTRCPVIELQDDKVLASNNESIVANTLKGYMRNSPSVDQNGNEDGTGSGMGWFPGYAINVETGERLNMAFGEDSWLGDQNGADMIWNPTSVIEQGFDPQNTNNKLQKWGGKHYIYVFGNTEYYEKPFGEMPSYDEGRTLAAALTAGIDDTKAAKAWSTCMWVGIPLLNEGYELLTTDVTVSLRVNKPYRNYQADTLANSGKPMYVWSTDYISTTVSDATTAENALEMVKAVPNPYYAFSEHYEKDKLDNVIKITNLPEECTVSIYNVSGTLVKRFDKSDPSTEIRWDLKNQTGVPIAGGLYLIHVEAPGIGETIVKWFGVLRPVDLQGF